MARVLQGGIHSFRGERDLIQQIRASVRTRTGALRLGIGDDCAVLRPPVGSDIVVTTDFTLEGRHFRRDWHPARSVGHRCIARGLSDLAAMGAAPMAAFLSLALPAGMDRRWVRDFFHGMNELAESVQVPLAGGDTAKAPGNQVLADIVLVGGVARGRALVRSGAKAGNAVFLTGKVGASAAELCSLMDDCAVFRGAKRGDSHPHLFPEPRLAVGRQLVRRRLATSAIDVSDGLSVDLMHLCEESGVDAVIEEKLLPLGGTLEQALHGGEDYELLFTSPQAVPKRIAGVPVTRIAMIEPRRGKAARVDIVRANGRRERLKPMGWEHRI